MVILIRKNSDKIRAKLMSLGFSPSEKINDKPCEGLFVEKPNNVFHDISEWDILRMFMETLDCGEDDNMFFDAINNIGSITAAVVRYDSIVKLGQFPPVNINSIKDVFYEENIATGEVCIVLVTIDGLKMKDLRILDKTDPYFNDKKNEINELYEQIKLQIK